jgi:hypothetical protein
MPMEFPKREKPRTARRSKEVMTYPATEFIFEPADKERLASRVFLQVLRRVHHQSGMSHAVSAYTALAVWAGEASFTRPHLLEPATSLSSE